MPISNFRTRLSTFVLSTLTTFVFTKTTQAGDRVAVSVAPLHSLVSHLLAGVDTPGLVFQTLDQRHALVPTTAALDKIEAAEMVVWVGAEYETALAGLRAIQPAQSLKGLTLSSTVPLLGLPDLGQPNRSNGKFVMNFWLDPRLAKVAVGRIAPQLVRLYPDQSDQILENEIHLKHRLMDMEHHFRHALGSQGGVPLHVPQSDVLYLAWRFNLAVPNCPQGVKTLKSFSSPAGESYYFDMLDAVLDDLQVCNQAT